MAHLFLLREGVDIFRNCVYVMYCICGGVGLCLAWKNNTIIEGECYDPDLPAQENTPPQKHRRTRSAGNVPEHSPASGIDHHQE